MKVFDFVKTSVARKLCLCIGLATAMILVISAWISYQGSAKALEAQTNTSALQQVAGSAKQLDDIIGQASVIPRCISARTRALGCKYDPNILPFFRELLKATPTDEAFDAYLAFDKGKIGSAEMFPNITRITYPNRMVTTYDHRDPTQLWYYLPKTTGKLTVTEPYFDDGGGNVSMISVTEPVYDDKGKFIAVSGTDITLVRVTDVVGSTHLTSGPDAAKESAFLVSVSGNLIADPDANLLPRKGFVGANASSLPLERTVLQSPQGFKDVRVGQEMRRIYWATCPTTGWKMALNVPQAEILAPVIALRDRTILVSVVSLAMMIALVYFIARKIVQPLSHITEAAARLATGDIDQNITVSSDDEVGKVADAFRDLISYQLIMVEVAAAVAAGDLSRDITPHSSKDLLGHTFSEMILKLRTLVHSIGQNATEVTSASGNLSGVADQMSASTAAISESMREVSRASEQSASGADEVARGNASQAHSIHQGAELLSQLSKSVLNVSGDARDASAAAAEAAEVAEAGAAAVQRSVGSMVTIRKSVEESAEVIHSLETASAQISSIVQTIETIAQQTNLLALNAAIEAARAGDAGRGFAVVADEVRKLADHSSKSAREIGQMVVKVQSGTSQAVSTMEAGTREVEVGQKLAEEAGDALQRILEVVHTVSGRVDGINIAAGAMTTSAELVSRAINEVAAVLEESSATAQEMSASAEEVSASVQTVSATTEQQCADIAKLTAASKELAAMAGRLEMAVDQFQLGNHRSGQTIEGALRAA